jgi:hypothetical protein
MKKILLMLTCLIAATVFASPRQNLVVDAAWLKAHLAAPVLHVGNKAEYEAAHIAEARFVSLSTFGFGSQRTWVDAGDSSGGGLAASIGGARDFG